MRVRRPDREYPVLSAPTTADAPAKSSRSGARGMPGDGGHQQSREEGL